MAGVWFFLSVSLGYAYFQQEVDYHIQVELLPEVNRLEASETILYHNHSLDTLDFIYFHLYVNHFEDTASKTGSLGYTDVISVLDNSGSSLPYEISGTVMKVNLSTAIAPGDSAALKIRFVTVLPPVQERFGYYGDHFDVGNWYPTPAVYDETGWHADQHLNGEFYQEWGNYRVDITLPKAFIVAATGTLLNPGVLPDSLGSAKRKMRYWNPSDTTRATYRFEAKRVHDFAWCADPEFVVKTVQLQDITLKFYIVSYRVEDWSPQLKIAARAVDLFQEKIGRYPYSQLSVVDSYIRAGGIEYPNLVMINDIIFDPMDLSTTIIHEIAHQWFYGLLANNQTRYGWMDEGFATFFENLGMQQIFGDTLISVPQKGNFFTNLFGYEINPRRQDLLTYLDYIRNGHQEPINLNFDWFQNDPYIPYYQKMSLVISQLQLVVGDEVFWNGIKEYFRRWRFRHPSPESLYRAFEDVSGQNLTWFFDEWLNTTWECDYAVQKARGHWTGSDSGRYYQAHVTFQRNKPIVMPFDFRVYLSDGTYKNYRIPVEGGSNFIAPHSSPIPPWKFYKKYKTVTLRLPSKIKRVELDPDHRLLDVNPFNNDNAWLPAIDWRWMRRQYLFPSPYHYNATIFPMVFYNIPAGVQLGLRTRGSYLYDEYKHSFRFLIGTRSLQPEADFWIEQPLYNIHPGFKVLLNLYNAAGRRGGGSWFGFQSGGKTVQRDILFGWQFRNIFNREYVDFPLSDGNISFLEGVISWKHWDKDYLPSGWELRFHGEDGFWGSHYNYQKWNASANIRFRVLEERKAEIRVFGGGIYGNPPLQKRDRVGGANWFDYFYNPFLRARGTLPSSWWEKGHIFNPGGGDVRAMAASRPPEENYIYSLNGRFYLGNPLNLTFHYIPYLSDIGFSCFSDWASTANQWPEFKDYYGDAGISLSLHRLPFLLRYFDISEIHFDFPLWVNKNIHQAKERLRWNIRIDIRSFY